MSRGSRTKTFSKFNYSKGNSPTHSRVKFQTLPSLDNPKTFGIRLKQPKHLTKKSTKGIKNSYKKRYSTRSDKLVTEVSGPVTNKHQLNNPKRNIIPVILGGTKTGTSTKKLPNYRRSSQPLR